ncbi:MAG: S1 RNA-binding domain-containing protein [Planctomycetota bacterium]|nr:S1 RNA-binding domain-containing protein [Planctomycetota bacterium]
MTKNIEKKRSSELTDRRKLLLNLKLGDVISGVVAIIPDFGLFIDLGGIDGLCTLTDMSWGRVSHPSDFYKVGDKIRVKVLFVDIEAERVLLGIKQLSEDPWLKVPENYPVGTAATAIVVNILSYGAFVRLERGIEGLIHISDLSSAKAIQHPSEVVAIDDEVEVIVLSLDISRQEISLRLK